MTERQPWPSSLLRRSLLKVIQMIPKVKPPRLVENEGSKDLRDFIPFTFTESPSDVRQHSTF
jgi:hypothetical protein